MQKIIETLLKPNPLTGWYDPPFSICFGKETWTAVDESVSFSIQSVGFGTLEIGAVISEIDTETLAGNPHLIGVLQDHVPGRICVRSLNGTALWYCLRVAEDHFTHEFLEEFGEQLEMLTEEGDESPEEGDVLDIDNLEKQLEDNS